MDSTINRDLEQKETDAAKINFCCSMSDNHPSVRPEPKMPVEDFSLVLAALGNTIRQRRKARGLSQEGLAELADLHRTYIADVEGGARNASIRNLARIARALGVSVSELCMGVV